MGSMCISEIKNYKKKKISRVTTYSLDILLSQKKKKKITPKKRSWSVWWSAASRIHCSFLNPGKTIISERYAQQIDEMH